MILKDVILENYRNYLNLEIELDNNINLFLGENAQGKTNFIEAVHYLATGRTFRSNKDQEIINWEKNYFRIKGKLIKKNLNREFLLDIYYDRQGNKKVKINGVKYKKISDLFGYLQVVIFSPDDLNIIKGSPAERRKYIDLEICQLISTYYNTLNTYNKVLQQRNNLLKEIRDNNQKRDILEVWDEQLVKYGSIIIKNRIEFLSKVVPLARRNQDEITNGKEKLDITYNSSIISTPTVEIRTIEKNFIDKIKQNKHKEIKKAITLFGPHRDDIIFYIEGKDLKTFGSQGQQRTAILSLKIAELNLFYYNNEEYPLLLLDDVMSELDDYRREFLMKVIRNNNIQTLITGANAELLDINIENKEVFNVVNGTIKGSRRF